MELLADGVAHFAPAFAFSVAVFVQMLESLFALKLLDGGSRKQIHIRGGAGEIQISAAIKDGGTG